MATVQRTTLIDDLDGKPAQETVTFGIDGVSYEIDLSEPNVDLLRARLVRFIVAARRVPAASSSASHRGRRSVAVGRRRGGQGEVRAWAASQGITMSTRGRIPAAVIEQYREAHP